MIVDVHSHPPRNRITDDASHAYHAQARPDSAASPTYTREQFIDVMKAVDRAIVFNIAEDPTRPDPAEKVMGPANLINEEISDFVRGTGGKFIGFASVHPKSPGCLAEIDRSVSELGLRGLKLAPNYQHFHPLSSEAFAVYRKAEELKLPILFHQGTSPNQFAELDYTHPRHMDSVAIAFPKLKIIMAHMGHPWQIECIVVIRKHPNVFADTSALFYRPWSYYNCMRLATEWSVLHKLLFGSDCPAAASPGETMKKMRLVNSVITGSALPPVPEEEIENIIRRDSLSLLGLAD